MRPCVPGFGAVRAMDRSANGTDGTGRSGYADRPPGLLAADLPFQGGLFAVVICFATGRPGVVGAEGVAAFFLALAQTALWGRSPG